MHRGLVDRHHAGESVIEEILGIQDEIASFDESIQALRRSLRDRHTPAALLLHTVADEQAYPLEVRQGAAWGLARIFQDGALDDGSRRMIRATLDAVIGNAELEESALRLADGLAASEVPHPHGAVVAAGDGDRAAVELTQTATALTQPVNVPATELGSFDLASRTAKRHRTEIRAYTGFRECSVADAEALAGSTAKRKRARRTQSASTGIVDRATERQTLDP